MMLIDTFGIFLHFLKDFFINEIMMLCRRKESNELKSLEQIELLFRQYVVNPQKDLQYWHIFLFGD